VRDGAEVCGVDPTPGAGSPAISRHLQQSVEKSGSKKVPEPRKKFRASRGVRWWHFRPDLERSSQKKPEILQCEAPEL